MGFFDALLGRTAPKRANLDDLFALPPAAMTLQAATGFVPTGVGAVAFRQVEGAAFQSAEEESIALIGSDPATSVTQTNDGFGYTWQVITDANGDVGNLVTNLHAVNAALVNQGFDSMLLCSTVCFADADSRRLALVYQYKRGTFYPFAQTGPQQRDNSLEIQVRGVLAKELPFEPDTSRWSALWDAPGLSQ
ncbi:hypothetical protein [Brevibacterium sp.]|uniref:PspA-associated protein PspAB n=1 Tax=Brevibacterium sp. TaxID=1701 RepID=UPI00281245EB|nr:hypothetical protein [Brevibacterium sp.]